jgi:hypothetical protein
MVAIHQTLHTPLKGACCTPLHREREVCEGEGREDEGERGVRGGGRNLGTLDT